MKCNDKPFNHFSLGQDNWRERKIVIYVSIIFFKLMSTYLNWMLKMLNYFFFIEDSSSRFLQNTQG